MSKFTKEMVDSYADKLLIGLSEEENKRVLDEFEEIDKQIDLINQIENIDNILSNCDLHTEREVKIPKVVG